MATKRMFSNIVIDSDSFLDLSPMQQLLYFHCGMKTDDDGFVSGARRIARIIGATEDDFAALVDNGFLLEFPDSKVFCIVHHRLNNDLKNDRYHQTTYQHEFEQLELTNNKEWRLKQVVSGMDTDCIHNVSEMDTEQNVTQQNVTQKNVTQESLEKESGERETDENILSALLLQAQHEGIQNLEKIKAIAMEKGIDSTHKALRKWITNNKAGEIEDYMEE